MEHANFERYASSFDEAREIRDWAEESFSTWWISEFGTYDLKGIPTEDWMYISWSSNVDWGDPPVARKKASGSPANKKPLPFANMNRSPEQNN